MTTILPPAELATIRSISKTAAVLLTCLMIDAHYPGRAIADFEVADILEEDVRTIGKKLRSLSAYGLMLEQRENKYVVTPLGRNTLFQNRYTSTLSIEETEIYSENPILCAQNVPHELIESINDLDQELNQSDHESKKCAQILQATEMLFGNAVSSSGISDRDPEQALAWISKAYADRAKLSNPAGLVYKRLKERVRPPVHLLKQPTKGLPAEFLEAVGMPDRKVDDEYTSKLNTLRNRSSDV